VVLVQLAGFGPVNGGTCEIEKGRGQIGGGSEGGSDVPSTGEGKKARFLVNIV